MSHRSPERSICPVPISMICLSDVNVWFLASKLRLMCPIIASGNSLRLENGLVAVFLSYWTCSAMRLQLDWEIPDQVMDESLVRDLTDALKLEAAVRLFSEGRISSGYAAHLLGIPRQAFADILHERKIPLYTYAKGELEAEVNTLSGAIHRGA